MATIEEMKLPSFLVHRDNRPPPPAATDQRLDGVDNDARKGWIVKLEFLRGNTRNSGTGFYINLPAAQDKDVILTAAHNLIDAEGQWSSDISFQSADGSPKRSITVRDKKSGGSEKAIDIAWLAVKVKSPGNEGSPEKEGPPEPRVEKVTVEGHLHVSERYTQPLYARMSSSGEAGPRFPMSLEDEIAPYDYGAIIFDRGKGDMPRGFGFSLMLGVDSKDTSGRRPKMVSPHGSVKLYGYASDEAQPRSWEGDYRTIPDQVMYNMNTKPGLSGSPVLTGYKSAETVIAIHNYGKGRWGKKHSERGVWIKEDRNKRGWYAEASCGTRLNLPVMREVFGWVGIGHFDKRLRVGTEGADRRGIYLHFSREYTLGNDLIGKAYIGSEGVVAFDFLPAWARGAKPDEPRRWIIQVKVPWATEEHENGGNWLVWDPVYGKVSLSDSIHSRCLVRLTDVKRPKKSKKAPAFHVEVEPEEGEGIKRLCMDISMLTETQITMGFRDVNGVSFRGTARKPAKSDTRFDQFCLESPVACESQASHCCQVI